MKTAIGLLAMWSLLTASSVLAQPVYQSEESRELGSLTCLVYDDNVFMCGMYTFDGDEYGIDRTLPYIMGCIGVCLPDYIENCPNGLEDVECYDFVTGG